MVQKKTYIYKSVADCNLQADVYRLPDDVIRPVILWLHGGALIMGNRETLLADQIETYIHAGCAVVAVDYRLAPEVKLETIMEDVLDAYGWICTSGPELFQIDPNRMTVIGHSAGGYLTLMLGFCVQPRPRALISFYGYGDIVGSWYSQPDPFYNQFPPVPLDEALRLGVGLPTIGTPFKGAEHEKRSRFYLYCRQQGRWPQEVSGHDPHREPDWFRPFCPIRNVTPEFPPTLFIHGDLDTDVPLQQSVVMAEELKRKGVEQELIVLSNRGHGFDSAGKDDPVVADVFARLLAFLDIHMMTG